MARDNVPPHNRHLMGHSEFLYGLKLICLPLNISELQAWRGRDSSNSSCILKNNIQHRNIERLSKRRHHISFIRIPILYLEMLWPILSKENPVLVVTVELIWLLFLNMLSFNFIQTSNKSLRFRKFRRSNVHHSVVVQTNRCQSCSAFLHDVCCPKGPHSFFCGCLSPKIVHLSNLLVKCC